MNICPVCRNVNRPDATVCRFCKHALTPPAELATPPQAQWRSYLPWLGAAAALVLILGIGGLTLFGGDAAAAPVTLVVGTGSGASLEFAPTIVEAPAQTNVSLTFTNQSTLPHNLTFSNGPITAKTSENVAGSAAETISFMTPDPGSYTFVCTIHPGMEGQLTVR